MVHAHLRTPVSSSFFLCSAHHRDLHSFPTRRSSDLGLGHPPVELARRGPGQHPREIRADRAALRGHRARQDRKSTRLNSSHRCISYAVFCLKKKKKKKNSTSIHSTDG